MTAVTLLRQRSFGDLDNFLSVQKQRVDSPEEKRPNYFIPGINGRARCLAGIKEGDTRTIYSCPTIFQSKDAVVKKKKVSLSVDSFIAHGGQTKTTVDTDTCTLSTNFTLGSSLDPTKITAVLRDRELRKQSRIKEVQNDISYFHDKYKAKQKRWQRIKRLDEQVDSTPLPIVDERYMSLFQAGTCCDTVVSPMTLESSMDAKKRREKRRKRNKKKRAAKQKKSTITGVSETKRLDHEVCAIHQSPTSVIMSLLSSNLDPPFELPWVFESSRSHRNNSQDSGDANSEVSLCSMDGGKTNIRFRRAQRLAAATSEDIRFLILKELAVKSAQTDI